VLAANKRGFTLIELTAVIVVIVILCAIAFFRIGDMRSGAFSAYSAKLQREFSKGVETLVASGDSVNNDLQSVVSTNCVQGAVNLADSSYMGLRTVAWHVSVTTSPSPSVMTLLLNTLNNHLTASGQGVVVIPSSDQLSSMLAKLNVDAVLAYNGARLQSVFLNFYP
jgi:prepilin-type N-terminal cleavage/methylation domain-containing protein